MSPRPLSVELQKRDLLILYEVAESPACLRRQLANAFFDGSDESAKKRIQILCRGGLIEPLDETRTGRLMLKLTETGRAVLEVNGFDVPPEARSFVPARMRLHEIMLSQFRATLLSVPKVRKDIWIDFTHGPDTSFMVDCPEHQEREVVRPDAYFTAGSLDSPALPQFFVEIDRGTETQGRLLHSVRLYDAYRRSGEFSPGDAATQKTAFRVLFIFENKERQMNAAINFHRNAGIRTLAWLTTLQEFSESPSGDVWMCPIDTASGESILKRSLFS